MKIKIYSVLLILALLFTGCTTKNQTPNETPNEVQNETSSDIPTQEATEITIGMMSSSDVIPYVLINEIGLAEKYNIKLNLEVFTSAKDRDAAFQAEEIDGVLTDYIGVCMYQNANFDVKITGITDGDYLLLAGKNTGITDISQIKGKSIAISENTLIDYTFDDILKNNNIDNVDVTREVVPRIPDRLELLRNDKIDLGLMPEPFATLALNDGAVLLGSANEFDLYPAVSAFSQTVLDEKGEAIHNLYKAYNEAVDYMNKTNIRDYEEIVVKAVGYPEEMIGKIEIKPFRTSELPPKSEIEEAIAWASNKGLCSSDLKYEQMIYDVYSE
ncbi:NitT/TauT family transport system substrate-binding protein [Sedimentibacter acidaminivorans]|jgi:NitT/TauT family transport system substrate-binding protein|uniref:NitT/TauT family transport system substrate-binding protein n=1 Tax=Sedimentibacter acidaminivorans TaxID=913099 RepID=A0ABS4GHJ9_9FIRM|nr:MetQ/NlpA family ABC transporter substrate-binding protein [Sedimentibacter acidaminivorans]MBP1927155.1 NitT/TauT family transport system substrate-binding protein [Sedimentibacter acidaminivorans]